MDAKTLVRSRIKAGRKGGAPWVRVLDVLRLLPTAEGRARLWTQIAYGDEVHQTTALTAEDRYPELFDLAARLAPRARRILSFGCSTGEELVSLRRRFPYSDIVGAEINPRSRRIAARQMASDPRIKVVGPRAIEGSFDVVFALAVLQRQPHMIAEIDAQDLSAFYPFARFDGAVCQLVGRLSPGGLLCVTNAHYRVEDSSAAAELEPVPAAPVMEGTLFGCDGRRVDRAVARTLFRKRG